MIDWNELSRLTQGYVVTLQPFTAVDVSPGNNKVVMCGTRLHVTETKQLIILQKQSHPTHTRTHTHRERESQEIQQWTSETWRTVGTYTKQDFCIRLVLRYLAERTTFAPRRLLSRHDIKFVLSLVIYELIFVYRNTSVNTRACLQSQDRTTSR